MASDTAQPQRQAMHAWPGNSHNDPTGPHRLGDIEHTCPCDPAIMEWHPGQGWVTVRSGSRQ